MKANRTRMCASEDANENPSRLAGANENLRFSLGSVHATGSALAVSPCFAPTATEDRASGSHETRSVVGSTNLVSTEGRPAFAASRHALVQVRAAKTERPASSLCGMEPAAIGAQHV
jgi:hypothetical protein